MRNQKLIEAYDKAFEPFDIAEKIISIPDSSDLDEVLKFFDDHEEFDLAFMQNSNGHIHSFIPRGINYPNPQMLFPGRVVSKDTNLLDLIQFIDEYGFITLLKDNEVRWLIDWQDLNKSPMTDWVFSHISLLEKTLKQLVTDFFFGIEEEAVDLLSKGRQDKIYDTYNLLRKKNAETSLLQCLYFKDCMKIALDQGWLNAVMGKDLKRKELNNMIHRLNELRNNAAHAQHIIKERDAIGDLHSDISTLRSLILAFGELDPHSVLV
jgi:hypothetical protein